MKFNKKDSLVEQIDGYVIGAIEIGRKTEFIVLSYEDYKDFHDELGAKIQYAQIEFSGVKDTKWEVLQRPTQGGYVVVPDSDIPVGSFKAFGKKLDRKSILQAIESDNVLKEFN